MLYCLSVHTINQTAPPVDQCTSFDTSSVFIHAVGTTTLEKYIHSCTCTVVLFKTWEFKQVNSNKIMCRNTFSYKRALTCKIVNTNTRSLEHELMYTSLTHLNTIHMNVFEHHLNMCTVCVV